MIGKDFPKCVRQGLPCCAMPWRKLLVSDGHKESAIQCDLYNCIGYLGAPVFLNRHMKNPKLTHDAKQAMNVYATLRHILALEDIPAGRSLSDSTYFGVEIVRRAQPKSGSSLYKNLVELVQPKGRALGWLGYEIVEADSVPSLSVYFYATAKTVPDIRRRLEALKVGVVRPYEDASISVCFPGDKSTNDSVWFQKVLRGVAARRVRASS